MFLIHLPSLKFKVLYARIRMEKAIIHLHIMGNFLENMDEIE